MTDTQIKVYMNYVVTQLDCNYVFYEDDYKLKLYVTDAKHYVKTFDEFFNNISAQTLMTYYNEWVWKFPERFNNININ